ncbi:MAG: diaminopimelate decarboxylase [Bacillota bacterium]|nr:diaminopimelate decarboxylase [Bacillota bacterium]
MMIEIKNNVLHFDGCSTIALAKKYGTPLYLYSENIMISKINEIKSSFLNKYTETRAAYAGKAFLTKYMCKLIEKEGLSLDVVSGGELYTAIKSDFPSERIEFNGNNKSIEELKMALDYNIGRIIVDNVHELDIIIELCREKNTTSDLLFRITPGVMSDTHEYITTGKKDSKFGIPLNEDILFPAVEKAIESKYVNFLGFHFHVGSQLNNNFSHKGALNVVLNLIKETKIRYDFNILEINIGGGFGIKYTEKDEPQPISYFVDPIMSELKDFCDNENLVVPEVVMEPGRFIVGEAGIQLYTIGSIKEIPGIRTYVSIDGGMTDNIRPGLYQAEYTGIIANKAADERKSLVTISGKCCESTDILIKDIKLPDPEFGDIFAVFSTGAYGYSMANNYNKIPIPGIVLVKNGKSEIIVKPQSYDEMISREVIPENLR